MSDFKISGHCTICDAPVYEILQVQQAHEKHPGEPKRFGRPVNGATRVTFLLYDGTRADVTFCGECAAGLSEDNYTPIWRKCVRSWLRETEGQIAPWLAKQFDSGILAEMGRKVVHG